MFPNQPNALEGGGGGWGGGEGVAGPVYNTGVQGGIKLIVDPLFASALGAVEDILDLIEIPDLSDLLPDIAGFLLDVLNSVADALSDAADAVGDAIGDVFGRSVVLRDPVSDALNEILDFLVNIIRAIIYVFMAFLFDKFLTNVRAQFAGSIISITFLVIYTVKTNLYTLTCW